MRLDELKICNYRNLDGVEIKLDHHLNFLVGENDLGKSNFLDLLDKVFNFGKFTEDDFFNKDENIKIIFSLVLNDGELGIFNDLFDPSDEKKLNIVCEMGISDDRIKFFHLESEDTISSSNLRCVNFINYKSLRSPSEELTFYKNRGVGKLLHHMVKELIKDESTDSSDWINKEYIEENIVTEINENFKKIRVFEEFGIEASVETDLVDLISRILSIKDSRDIHIRKIGHGVQFSVLIVLYILEKLLNLIETKRLKRCIFEEEGVKSISLILGLDEPEIHLHPYRQRNLIKYVSDLMNNEEEDFSILIRGLFDIDLIYGQSIIVTHSPNILSTDYKQISRFHRKDGRINVRCGSNISLEDSLYKFLLKASPYIKEAFFSRFNIIVEGDTELGALPKFADRMDNLDLDDLGVSVIPAGGIGAIPPLTKILGLFNIGNMGIMDGKEFKEYENDIIEENLNIVSTAYDDFEEDIFKSFKIVDYIKWIETEFPRNRMAFKTAADNLGKSIDITQPLYEQIDSFNRLDKFLLKKSITQRELDFLRKKKSILMGRNLASGVSKIPASYETLLLKAKREAYESYKI